jgi:hypothetical protein
MEPTEYDTISPGPKHPSNPIRQSMNTKDLSTITMEDFEPCLNQSFRIKSEASDSFELIQIKPIGNAEATKGLRQPFSLLFRGPGETLLEQQVFVLNNKMLGELALFLVPIGPDDDGTMLYDAAFN